MQICIVSFCFQYHVLPVVNSQRHVNLDPLVFLSFVSKSVKFSIGITSY